MNHYKIQSTPEEGTLPVALFTADDLRALSALQDTLMTWHNRITSMNQDLSQRICYIKKAEEEEEQKREDQ